MKSEMAHFRDLRSIFIAALVLLLSACALPGTPDDTNAHPFAEPAAAEVISVGFDNIADKYIEPVTLARVGLEGLRGLGVIDAGLTLKQDNGMLVMLENDVEIARMRPPVETDSRAWAAVVVALTETARAHSADIRAASAERVYEAIFDGALSDLDIFSRYAGQEEATRNRARRDGFGGVGIRFRLEDGIAVITKVIIGTPAANSGLTAGDRIIRVNETNVSGLVSAEVTNLIRGPVHTSLRLTIDRPDAVQPFTIEVARAHIVPESVTTKVEDGIGIIRISTFNQDTGETLERQLRALTAPGARPVIGLVIDLRGNPGGLLRQSIKVADLLLTQGEILRTVGRHPDSLHHYEAAGSDLAVGLPIVVMIDGRSASAAEIVAAALQDRDRAVVVGTSSYGKGSVQTVIRLPNDGEITLTWSKFVTPSGYYLHGMGVVPTVCTSGQERLQDADQIIEAALGDSQPVNAVNWRQRAYLKDGDRASLRSNCPSERRPGRLDLEIAKRLILNDRLHVRALRLTTTTAEATH